MDANAHDFPDTLYVLDRAAAKGAARHPLTLEYIKRLERIAEAALAFYNHSPRCNASQSSYRDNLYDALDAVNLLDESL